MAFLGQSGVGPFHPKLQVPRPMLYLDLCFPCREKYKPLGFLCLRVIGSGEKKISVAFCGSWNCFLPEIHTLGVGREQDQNLESKSHFQSCLNLRDSETGEDPHDELHGEEATASCFLNRGG